MNTFAYDLCGEWRNGNLPKCDKIIAHVQYDLKHHKYIIERRKIDSFKGWVIDAWCADSDYLWEVYTEEDEEGFFDKVDLRFYEIEDGEYVNWGS